MRATLHTTSLIATAWGRINRMGEGLRPSAELSEAQIRRDPFAGHGRPCKCSVTEDFVTYRVLFLHGIGGLRSPDAWLPAVNRNLGDEGFELISPHDLVMPNYLDLLSGATPVSDSVAPPPETWTRSPDDRRTDERSHYVSRRRLLESRLRPTQATEEAFFGTVPDVVGDKAAEYLRQFVRVQNYRRSAVRRSVWTRALADVEPHDRLVIIGHSLGSVVAVDLIPHLPDGVEVQTLLTVGSPLGFLSSLREHSRRMKSSSTFPFERLRSWVNIYDPNDLITGGRGVSGAYPDALDIPVRNSRLLGPASDHGIEAYAEQESVAVAIGQPWAGASLRKREQTVPVRMVPAQWYPLLLKFAYAQQVQKALPAKEKSVSRRWSTAREELADRAVVEAELAVEDLRMQGAPESLIRSVAAHPTFDDFLRRPTTYIEGVWSDEEIAVLSVPLMLGWPLPPFEILTSAKSTARKEALVRLLDCIRGKDKTPGLSNIEFAEEITQSIALGDRVLPAPGSSAAVWRLVGLAGLVVLAATGVGLVAAVPAGLAGAAAMTAGLAAFGPGGMAGGIATLMALSAAGGAAAGFGGLGAAGSEQQDAARRLRERRARTRDALGAVAINGDRENLRLFLSAVIAVTSLVEGLDQDPARNRRREFRDAADLVRVRLSDEWRIHEEIAPDTTTTKELRAKVKLLERAINWFNLSLPEGDIRAELKKSL